tara:strand:- start:573 stop:1160 length:588 start_codon:yes stop_codon:yes gene_type:complete
MKRALIGNGGHAREVMFQMEEPNIVRFVGDKYWREEPSTLPLSNFNPSEYEVMVAVGDSIARFDLIHNILPTTTKYFSFTHPTAIIGEDVEIGEGSFIGAYSILTSNIKVGNHAILNRANHIGHDTVVGSYLSMMPGAIISGDCRIDDCVYIGTNSSIKEKLSIHNLTTIGLNSGVVKDIESPGIYAGSPAKKIK